MYKVSSSCVYIGVHEVGLVKFIDLVKFLTSNSHAETVTLKKFGVTMTF